MPTNRIPTNPYDPIVDPGEYIDDVFGMTKREHFAACAMQSILSQVSISDYRGVAKMSVKYADALIEELNS